MFSKDYKIKYHEIDENNILKPNYLLYYLEDIAANNANSLGFGYDFLSQKNYGWFLLKYTMEFYNYPQHIMNLRLETQPRGINKIFAYRDFYIYNAASNDLLGKISSTWCMVDLLNKTTLNPAEILNGLMPPFEKRADDLKYNKIPPLNEVTTEKTFTILYEDIDVNSHVNNATYIVWAFNTLPYEFRKNKKLKQLDITYKKEIQYGNNVISKVSIQDNSTIHIIQNEQTQEDLAMFLAQWE